MQRIAMFIMMTIAGAAISIVSCLIMFPINIVGVMFGSMLPVMAIMQIFAIAKQKNFLPLYKDLEKNEKYLWIPDVNNRIHLTIMKTTHKGLLYLKGLGLFEDKGTTFVFGKDRMGFAFPESGYTGDIPTLQYFSKLFKKEPFDISDWDSAVKAFLYSDDWERFQKKFRRPHFHPTIENIYEELDWLSERRARDELRVRVFGETVDFRSRCRFLRYNYDPVAAENATEAEKIIAYKRATDYKDPSADYSKYGAIAKAVVIIVFGVALGIAILSSIDLSNFAGLFGG